MNVNKGRLAEEHLFREASAAWAELEAVTAPTAVCPKPLDGRPVDDGLMVRRYVIGA